MPALVGTTTRGLALEPGTEPAAILEKPCTRSLVPRPHFRAHAVTRTWKTLAWSPGAEEERLVHTDALPVN